MLKNILLSLLSITSVCSHQIGYMSSSQVDRVLRHQCNGTTLNRLIRITPYQYTPRVISNAYFRKGDSYGHHQYWIKDAEQSYKQAVVFACTGEKQYANNAMAILRAWPNENYGFSGPNALLEAGWGTASMARAVALLQHAKAAGWTDNDTNKYLRWVEARLNLLWNDKVAASWNPNKPEYNNWQVTNLDARLSLALLKNDVHKINWCVGQFKAIANYFVTKDGFIPADDVRDFTHIQFSLGGIMQVAEALYLQGHDLYMYPDGRLVRLMEKHAVIANGGLPSGINHGHYNDSNWVLPCGWHLALRHYRDRLHMKMPQTAQAYSKVYWPYSFHWGLSDI